ncbi:hypothetical protein QY96_03274 [Bacillus thermotolerans]|nr:hypothetical protein QY96_03274 [Bacillus thermotolerans]
MERFVCGTFLSACAIMFILSLALSFIVVERASETPRILSNEK